ncbi:Protein FAF-like, chloroplastic [Apostasia shenzhenica]|uniref:Protein FAF-like, chloroplastic n=1 Tax=Apostasia shenzhenica TaxID=1088818 RepID=A0A2I0BDA9_9ASPA|nr:Protein FAF-like, chloroplastic [Apostasia shenzhenica]
MFGELCHPPSSSTSTSSAPPLPRRTCIDTMSEPGDTAALEIFGELCYPVKTTEDLAGGVAYTRCKSTRERRREVGGYTRSYSDVRQRITASGGSGYFPPPITTIGRSGKPRVYFKSFREDGRFVLREIRIPTQRLLQATRGDGRLTMRVLQPENDGGKEQMKEGDDKDGGDL